MQANWSLILNILLLIGIITAFVRLMQTKRQNINIKPFSKPSLGSYEKEFADNASFNDDIIAVRKINTEKEPSGTSNPEAVVKLYSQPVYSHPSAKTKPLPLNKADVIPAKDLSHKIPTTLMLFICAKENRQFAGYELLQTILAVGLRFGEGNLFHRHQSANGEGPILCSLAAATTTGVFDLQNIGGFSVRGLCLFMQTTKNNLINSENFAAMLATAKQLSEELDAALLDDKRKPLTEETITYYHNLLQGTCKI